MAVAAYASVLSLLRVIDNIQHPSRLRLFPDTTQIEALREKLCILQDFFKPHSSAVSKDIECVARKISRVTTDAESEIDNYVVDQLYRESEDLHTDVVGWNIVESFHNEIHRVTQKIESINKALMTLRTLQHDQEQPKVSGTSLTFSRQQKTIVGFEDQSEQVLKKLISNRPNLEILPIVGMGGIGKTTLARSVFDHSYNLHHFHVRIWLTISQDYSVKKILQGHLEDGILDDNKKDRESDESELIMQLHKKLFGQRYLIVLDDVWSAKAWDDLKWSFPDNKNGSRIMVTTRLSDIASSLDSWNNSYSMKFLDKDKSWDLFSAEAFGLGGRSLELEEIGREISKSCKGLPLLLVVIGGLLANSNMTVEYWKIVAKNINSFANSAYDEYCLRILSLSYHHLPIHLKPCFLYMRHTLEDSNIKVSELIKTWVVQGFVKPMRGKSLEEAARKYLEDLVSRNMLLIRKRGRNRNIKFCGIHDLLRDLCIKESNKEQLLEVPRIISVSDDFDEACFLCKAGRRGTMIFYTEIVGSESAYNNGKILVCSSCESKFPEFARSRFVATVKIDSQNAPLMTKCRWLIIDHSVRSAVVLHTVRLIWNLEFLDIKSFEVVLPKELWEMSQLRQVKVTEFTLPDPVSTTNDVIVLENLKSLTEIQQFKFTEEIVRRIPNLRKLGVWYDQFPTDKEEDWSCFHLQNIAYLKMLESLSIYCKEVYLDFNLIAFPMSLNKLSLEDCKIYWDDLRIIGSLPNLEVLKLRRRSVLGKDWTPVEGKFLSLKCLKLAALDLVRWRVNETHFPALEILSLHSMTDLEAIPREIGELPSLNSIYLKWCTENVINSAKDIENEQQSYGNEGLEVHAIGPIVYNRSFFSFS